MNIIRLKEVLAEKGVSGKELALKLGVSQNTISNIVKGYNFPKPNLLIGIARELDIDVRELLISTKEKDLTSPTVALKEIKSIIDRIDLSSE